MNERASVPGTVQDRSVNITIGGVMLKGRLTVPQDAVGIVVFAHGSGSSRLSPRNWYVAEILHHHCIATLLTDLLTGEEDVVDMNTRQFRFDIPLLTGRLLSIAHWVETQPETCKLTIGYFGSSTGGAAVLIAAAREPSLVKAVVSRGGRVDLAGDYLADVNAPVQLIVGEFDYDVLMLNEEALGHLNDRSELQIIPGASHLFEEPGCLEKVALSAAAWFNGRLR